jgi:hypothetical protein
MKFNWFFKGLTGILAIVGFIAVVVILMALPVQLLWNYCLVGAIDGVQPIGFWQALGIIALVAIMRTTMRDNKQNT